MYLLSLCNKAGLYIINLQSLTIQQILAIIKVFSFLFSVFTTLLQHFPCEECLVDSQTVTSSCAAKNAWHSGYQTQWATCKEVSVEHCNYFSFNIYSVTNWTGIQNKTKQNKTKQNKTKQNKTKQNKTKQIVFKFIVFLTCRRKHECLLSREFSVYLELQIFDYKRISTSHTMKVFQFTHKQNSK